MKKIIYHGSKDIIKKPKYGVGKPYNDYGLGFYCTESLDLAKEWGVDEGRDGYANIYDLDIKDLKVLNLNDEKYCILHWLAVLLKNRFFKTEAPLPLEVKEYIVENFLVDYSDVDIMIGYRADDSYFAFAQDFINNTISYNQLNKALRLGGLGEQIVLVSKKAFERIKYVGYENALNSEWFPKKENRDKTARNDYYKMSKKEIDKDGLYVLDIIREEMKSDDPRLR